MKHKGTNKRKPATHAQRAVERLGAENSPAEESPDWERMREQLLNHISEGARHCAEIEREFGRNPPPELETLIKLHRLMVFQVSSQEGAKREAIGLITALMRPVMEWARLQEKRKERELSEQKYRDQVEAQKAALEREQAAANAEGGLSPETLEKIERELRLM